MANSWLRLWHDMPNDPKWRTIARQSGKPISLVIAVYVHLLVDASRNVTRGHANVTVEDLASALDVTEDEIRAVLAAMDGRVIEGDFLLGWDKRQPKREDVGDSESGAKSAAERKRAQREREKEAGKQDTGIVCHDESRNVTLDKDKETDKETNPTSPAKPDDGFEEFWKAYPKRKARGAATKAWSKVKSKAETLQAILKALAWQRTSPDWTKDGGQFIPYPASYLNAQGWLDEAPAQSAAPIPFDREAYEAKRKAELAVARERYQREQEAIVVSAGGAK